jgi:peptidoglycan/LPS O-acetylase OafA/YrhL
MLVVGLASMPALHGLTRAKPASASPTLLFLGRMSFAIYLFNTPCIGLAKGVLLQGFSWNGAGFLLFAPLLLASGLFGPILLKCWALPRVKLLDRMTA